MANINARITKTLMCFEYLKLRETLPAFAKQADIGKRMDNALAIIAEENWSVKIAIIGNKTTKNIEK